MWISHKVQDNIERARPAWEFHTNFNTAVQFSTLWDRRSIKVAHSAVGCSTVQYMVPVQEAKNCFVITRLVSPPPPPPPLHSIYQKGVSYFHLYRYRNRIESNRIESERILPSFLSDSADLSISRIMMTQTKKESMALHMKRRDARYSCTVL